MLLGSFQLDTVSGGRFRLDGGAMFGVVPKPVWEKQQPADGRNRIRLNTNCVLARDGTQTVLLDTGFGTKCSEKETEQMELETGDTLVENLARLGVGVDDVDVVVFSHLHFDHAGGGTRRDAAGNVAPTFPRATYVAQRLEWEDATGGAAELQGAYPAENLVPLEESGRLRLVDDGEQVVSGLTAIHSGGHTRGHQVLRFESGGSTAIYLGDLCPTHSHMPTLWGMAYDTHPLDTRRRKPKLLQRAADENWLILWDHDPDMAAARIGRDARGRFEVVERIETL